MYYNWVLPSTGGICSFRVCGDHTSYQASTHILDVAVTSLFHRCRVYGSLADSWRAVVKCSLVGLLWKFISVISKDNIYKCTWWSIINYIPGACKEQHIGTIHTYWHIWVFRERKLLLCWRKESKLSLWVSIESFQVYFGVYGWFLFKKDTKVECHEDTIKKKNTYGLYFVI